VTNITLEATANSEVFAFECDGKYFVIKENGIYIMDGLPVNATLGNDNATVVRINDFVLKPGDSILDVSVLCCMHSTVLCEKQNDIIYIQLVKCRKKLFSFIVCEFGIIMLRIGGYKEQHLHVVVYSSWRSYEACLTARNKKLRICRYCKIFQSREETVLDHN